MFPVAVLACCSVLQRVAVCCSGKCSRRWRSYSWLLKGGGVSSMAILARCSVLQCVAVCCSVLQCVAVCCSVLQCVAVCCSITSVSRMGCPVSGINYKQSARYIRFFSSSTEIPVSPRIARLTLKFHFDSQFSVLIEIFVTLMSFLSFGLGPSNQ